MLTTIRSVFLNIGCNMEASFINGIRKRMHSVTLRASHAGVHKQKAERGPTARIGKPRILAWDGGAAAGFCALQQLDEHAGKEWLWPLSEAVRPACSSGAQKIVQQGRKE